MSYENKGSLVAKVLVSREPDRRGNIICNGISDETEINLAFTYLTSGRTHRECVKLIGDFAVDGPIQVPSYTVLDLTEARIYLANTSNCAVIENSDQVAGNDDIEIIGGFINANWENQTGDSYGVYMWKVTNFWIHQSVVRGGYRSGAFPGGEGIFCRECYDVVISENYCYEAYYDDIKLVTCQRFVIDGNVCYGASQDSGGIQVGTSSAYGVISNNAVWKTGTVNAGRGIKNHASNWIVISNNLVYGQQYGIDLIDSADYNLIEGNTTYHCGGAGFIHRDSTGLNNTVRNNVFKIASDQVGIRLEYGDNYVVKENTITSTDDVPATTVGIQLLGNAVDCVVKNNNFLSVATCIQNAGVNTVFDVKQFQFTEPIGTAAIVVASPTGIDVDANTEGALAWGQLPMELHQTMRLKVWAVATDAPIGAGGQMHLELIFNAGASNAAYNEAAKSWTVANFDGEEADYVANDVVHWVVEDADVGNELGALVAGDSFELIVMHEAGADPDGATDALFRVVEVEYV